MLKAILCAAFVCLAAHQPVHASLPQGLSSVSETANTDRLCRNLDAQYETIRMQAYRQMEPFPMADGTRIADRIWQGDIQDVPSLFRLLGYYDLATRYEAAIRNLIRRQQANCGYVLR